MFAVLLVLFAVVVMTHRAENLVDARAAAPQPMVPGLAEVGNIPGVVPGTEIRVAPRARKSRR